MKNQQPSFAQNFNRYSYCLNNPLKFTDPSGYLWQSSFWDNFDYLWNMGTDGSVEARSIGGHVMGWIPSGGGGGSYDPAGYTYQNGQYLNSNGNSVDFGEVYNWLVGTNSFSEGYFNTGAGWLYINYENGDISNMGDRFLYSANDGIFLSGGSYSDFIGAYSISENFSSTPGPIEFYENFYEVLYWWSSALGDRAVSLPGFGVIIGSYYKTHISSRSLTSI